MNNGLYDYHSYTPEPATFAKNIESLNVKALKFPPTTLDTNKLAHEWDTFSRKASFLAKSFFTISVLGVPALFWNHPFVATAAGVTVLASTIFGCLALVRSCEADSQVNIWPMNNLVVNQTKFQLEQFELKKTADQRFESCVAYFSSLSQEADDYLSSFFDELKNPLVQVQTKFAVVLRSTNEVFDFYPRLKADYMDFIQHTKNTLSKEQIVQNVAVFIKAYVNKDAAELKVLFGENGMQQA